VDGPPLARGKIELRIAGWCGHVSDLFMRLYLPLAIMPFARTGSRSLARTRGAWVVLGFPGPAVWAGFLHQLLFALSNLSGPFKRAVFVTQPAVRGNALRYSSSPR
jgi:hypothetical protein